MLKNLFLLFLSIQIVFANSIILNLKDFSNHKVVLKNGVFNGNHLYIKVLKKIELKKYKILLLFINYGGSGNFREIAVLKRGNDGNFSHIQQEFIGDRVKVTKIKLKKLKIIIDYLDRGLTESFVIKPHIKKRVEFKIKE